MSIIQDTASLTPEFRIKVELLFKKLREAGINNAYIWESRRTQERQYELFWQGRTVATLKKYWVPTQYAKPGKIVTWTLDSMHLKGRAIDIVFNTSIDPKIKKPSWSWNYAKVIEIAKSIWIRNLTPIETCHFEI